MYTAYPNFQVQSGDLYRALCAIREVDGLACIHAENGDVIDVLRERAVTRQAELPLSSAYWHALTRPPQIECESVNSVVTFAEHTGARVLIFHLGCEDAVQIIGAAKARGVSNVFGETCPQYLALTDDYLKRDDGRMWVCSPPLRTQRDQDAMWRMLRSGALDIISSDHCPYTRAQKESSRNDFRQMPGGVPGIETRLGLAHQLGVRAGHISLGEWVRSCCTRPAEIHNLKNKGRIAVNYDADIVIFDPTIHKSLTQDQLHMNVDFSPYVDLTCEGWTRDVISRGEVIVERQQFVGAIGRGKFVKR
jgi:dihydropyrimidinase